MSPNENRGTMIKDIDAKDFSLKEFNSSMPLVIRNIVSHWPLVQESKKSDDACLRYVMSYYNGAPIVSFLNSQSSTNSFSYSDDLSKLNFNKVSTTLDNIIKKLAAGLNQEQVETIYMGSTTLDYVLPEMAVDNHYDMANIEPLESIWIGNRTTVPAHYDIPDNLAFVCAGSRRFTLFPPEQLENLYIGPLDFTPAGQSISMVNIKNPNFNHHPKYLEAKKTALIADLSPGDGIYIPSLWWHQVESFGDVNVLINYWWRDTPAYHGLPQDALLHSILSIRDIPKGQKAHWKRIFDYYVFDSDEKSFEHIPSDKRGFLGSLDENMARRLRALLMSNLNR